MPMLDGTGPNGQGQMTGKKMGFCNSPDKPRNFRSKFGSRSRMRLKGAYGNKGAGCGMGRGRGNVSNQEIEVIELRDEISELKAQISTLVDKLDNLEQASHKEN